MIHWPAVAALARTNPDERLPPIVAANLNDAAATPAAVAERRLRIRTTRPEDARFSNFGHFRASELPAVATLVSPPSFPLPGSTVYVYKRRVPSNASKVTGLTSRGPAGVAEKCHVPRFLFFSSSRKLHFPASPRIFVHRSTAVITVVVGQRRSGRVAGKHRLAVAPTRCE